MIRFGIIVGVFIFAGQVRAQDYRCLNEAVTQTQAKISQHYAAENMRAKLAYIKTVDLSGVISNGPVIDGAGHEDVEYTSYTILGALVIEGKGQFNDYAFYVRVGTRDCRVLRVALLRTGESPFLALTANGTPTQAEGGLTTQGVTLSKIETPRDGSPRIGYTFTGPGEVSKLVENEMYLQFLIKRADQLVERPN